MLDHRKVVETIDGDPTDFLRDDNAPVLLAVHHHRLVHVIANFAAADPVADPVTWLDQVEREADPARRMRRKLVDDTAVYACDLDVEEADWLSRRVRGDDGLPLAEAFGLHLERRAEGAAFVVPADAFRSRSELGESPFPAGGTVAAASTCRSTSTTSSPRSPAGAEVAIVERARRSSQLRSRQPSPPQASTVDSCRRGTGSGGHGRMLWPIRCGVTGAIDIDHCGRRVVAHDGRVAPVIVS